MLLEELREAGASDAARTLAGWAAKVGMFDVFLEVCVTPSARMRGTGSEKLTIPRTPSLAA